MYEMTYGYELELGDVVKARELPSGKFGTWEHHELDIVNIHPPYRGTCPDPITGLHPPVGGEINIYPAHSPVELADRIMGCIEWFRKQGDRPSASVVNHGHVHIRCKGLRDNIKDLKKLVKFSYDNHATVLKGYQWVDGAGVPAMYMKLDGGRKMPDYRIKNILEQSTDIDSFLHWHRRTSDVNNTYPMLGSRYAVNMYTLKYIDTIEYRAFRASLVYEEILGSILFAKAWIEHGLLGEPPPNPDEYSLPKLIWDKELFDSWKVAKSVFQPGGYGHSPSYKQKDRVLYDI